MTPNLRLILDAIHKEILALPLDEFLLTVDEEQRHRAQQIAQIISRHTEQVEADIRERIHHELTGWGPIHSLLQDETVTEILLNGPSSIWFEKEGCLHALPDMFYSRLSYRNFVDRLCHQAQVHVTQEHPCADGRFEDFRLSLIGDPLTHTEPHLSLRRHPKNPWTVERLNQAGWCEDDDMALLEKLVSEKKNFIIIGTTGSGKTSILNALLSLLPPQERALVIEDTPEISLPNLASMKLLTREDTQGVLPPIDQTQLVKRALRLRPDRIVMGEVRGSEAKDFLMALATGHSGSFGTLHARDPQQALLRLEMLIQMGAPQWNLTAIRRLIQLSLDYVVVTEKSPAGQRRFAGLWKICSLEETGFLVERVSR